jgi:hypothetical protein
MKRSFSPTPSSNATKKQKEQIPLNFPTYVLFNICTFLPYSDTIKFQRVSTNWKNMINSGIFERLRYSEFPYKTIVPNIYTEYNVERMLLQIYSTYTLNSFVKKNVKVIFDQIETNCTKITFMINEKKVLIQNCLKYKLVGDRLFILCVYKKKIGESFHPSFPGQDDPFNAGLYCVSLTDPLKWTQIEHFGLVYPPFNREFTHDDFLYGVFNCFISVYFPKGSNPLLICLFGSIIAIYSLNDLRRVKIKRIPIDNFSVKQFDVLDSNIILLESYRDPDECPACGRIISGFITVFDLNGNLKFRRKIESGTSKELIISAINKMILSVSIDKHLTSINLEGNKIWEKELECTNVMLPNESIVLLCSHDVLDIRTGKSINL